MLTRQVVYKASDLMALTIFQVSGTITNYGGRSSLSSPVAIDLLISYPDDLIRRLFTSRTSPKPSKSCG